MRQKISVSIAFSDLSRTVSLNQIYQKGNALIAISYINLTGNAGEATCVRKDSVWVETGAESELPVKHYIVNTTDRGLSLNKQYTAVKTIEQIRGIEGLQPLPFDKVNDEVTGLGSRFFSGLADIDDTADPLYLPSFQ